MKLSGLKFNIKSLFYLLLSVTILSACAEPQKQEAEEKTTEKDLSVSNVNTVDWAKNANIYEVNLRQFTGEGTIKAFMRHIPRLKNMGVDILWFMPVHPIGEKNRKGSLGSYYAVKDYVAINPEFGTMADFKSMVKLAHSLEMKVILDWVANHTAWDHAWVSEHPEYYDLNENGEMYAPHGWEDVVQLDYDNKDLWPVMIGELEFWVREANIDGYRCDVASMVPTAFWDEARVALDNIKPVFMLAEAEEPDLLVDAFDMDYGWHFHHLTNRIAAGDTTADVIARYHEELKAKLPKGAFKMNFTSNHDENSWNGTVHERYGEGFQTFAVLVSTVPGMPLIYSGQEAAMDKRLEFFEKDPIDWNDYSLEGFYRTLLNLKKRNQALWNGNHGGEYVPVKTSNDAQIVAFTREKDGSKVFVVLNLSPDDQTVQFAGSNYPGEYTDVFSNEKVTFIQNHQLQLKGWEYRVYEK
jgi:glycosidase